MILCIDDAKSFRMAVVFVWHGGIEHVTSCEKFLIFQYVVVPQLANANLKAEPLT